MRKVDHSHDAKHQRETKRDEGVETSEEGSIHQGFGGHQLPQGARPGTGASIVAVAWSAGQTMG
ncbi:unannotated protein [freshwater metagenome]|uniref:Unannotated protein n=1 Tax=freshwater metagenome TaxID=449393 RepID=A0A6J7PTQ9_9ZZZZ